MRLFAALLAFSALTLAETPVVYQLSDADAAEGRRLHDKQVQDAKEFESWKKGVELKYAPEETASLGMLSGVFSSSGSIATFNGTDRWCVMNKKGELGPCEPEKTPVKKAKAEVRPAAKPEPPPEKHYIGKPLDFTDDYRFGVPHKEEYRASAPNNCWGTVLTPGNLTVAPASRDIPAVDYTWPPRVAGWKPSTDAVTVYNSEGVLPTIDPVYDQIHAMGDPDYVYSDGRTQTERDREIKKGSVVKPLINNTMDGGDDSAPDWTTFGPKDSDHRKSPDQPDRK